MSWEVSRRFVGPDGGAPRDSRAAEQLAQLLSETAIEMRTINFDPIAVAAADARKSSVPMRGIQVGPFAAQAWGNDPEDVERSASQGPHLARRALALLTKLEQAGWRDLAAAAAPKPRWPTSTFTPAPLCALSLQGDDLLCSLDAEFGVACYRVTGAALEFLGFGNVTLGTRRPIGPIPVSGPGQIKSAEPWEKIEFRRWSDDTRLDPEGIVSFAALVADAAKALRALGPEPLVVASCPQRFNDALGDENWEALQVGKFGWENGVYFANHEKALASGPAEARAAKSILNGLKASAWRDRYTVGFGRAITWGEVSAVICQDGRDHFVVVDSNCGDGAVYQIGPAASVKFVGICSRIDWEIGKSRVLRWMPLDAWAQASTASFYGVDWDRTD